MLEPNADDPLNKEVRAGGHAEGQGGGGAARSRRGRGRG